MKVSSIGWTDWRKTRMNTAIGLAIVVGAWYNVVAVRHGAAVRAPTNRGTTGSHLRVLVPLSDASRSIFRSLE